MGKKIEVLTLTVILGLSVGCEVSTGSPVTEPGESRCYVNPRATGDRSGRSWTDAVEFDTDCAPGTTRVQIEYEGEGLILWEGAREEYWRKWLEKRELEEDPDE